MVEQLKRWLKCRGLKQSGKKSDLVVPVRNCCVTGSHTGKGIDVKLRKTNVTEEYAPTIPKSGWEPFPSYDILLNYDHVDHYAVETLPALPDDHKCFDDDEDGEEGTNEQRLGPDRQAF